METAQCENHVASGFILSYRWKEFRQLKNTHMKKLYPHLYLKQEGNYFGFKDQILSLDKKHESHVEFPFDPTQLGKECYFDRSKIFV